MDILKKIKFFFSSSIDIGSKSFPELSNFIEYHFHFKGEEIHSMEGLLQGIKFKDISKQKEIFKLVGSKAKFKGKKSKWKENQILYFQDQSFKRDSKEYQDFLYKAFETLFTNNPTAQKNLLATKKKKLTHTIGTHDITQTVLTEKEFCSILIKIRNNLQKNYL